MSNSSTSHRQEKLESNKVVSRRSLFKASVTAGVIVSTTAQPANAITRAIGGAEEACREAGNCLEIGEWDGAVGWSWGGKDRCDPSDPLCGSDGKLRESIPSLPVPDVGSHKITHSVTLTMTVGRGELATLKLGLYGDEAPQSVKQFLQFCSSSGIKAETNQNSIGLSPPVSLSVGGILGQVVPNQRLDFGVPVQSAAFARNRGLSKAGDEFVPQPRPTPITDEASTRLHTEAGLLSVAAKGIGWGGTGFETEDECFESAFQLTSTSIPSMDSKEKRRVIGQAMDPESMATLTRLASLPTKKGFKGVIPGQTSGPPLLNVRITNVDIQQI